MADKWIPVRELLPETEDWVIAMTQDGTQFPARYKNKQWQMWSSLPNSGLVEQLMHGKVAYWQSKPEGYPYVQCKCGAFYLQAEGRKECPICAAFHPEQKVEEKKPRAKKEKEPVVEDPIPFTDPLEEEFLP